MSGTSETQHGYWIKTIAPHIIILGGFILTLVIMSWTIFGAYGTLHVVEESGQAIDSIELTNGDSRLLVHFSIDSSEISAVHLINSEGTIEARQTSHTGATAAEFFIGGIETDAPWKVIVIGQSGEIVGEVKFEISRHEAWEDGIP